MNTSLKALAAATLTVFGLSALAAPGAGNTQPQDAVTHTTQAQALVRSAMDEYLSLWTSNQSATFDEIFHQDVSLKYSLSIPEVNGIIDGRDSLAKQVTAISHLGTNWKFDDVKLFATNNPNTYFVQYTAKGKLVRTGETFVRPAIVVIETDGSKVTGIQELSNPAIAESSLAGDATTAKNFARVAR